MTGKEYKDIIDSFDVENNSNYQPSDDGQTYCNIFAQDVAEECDTPLPTGGCTSMLNSLCGNKFPNWYSVNFTMAQQRANNGAPTIAITDDHIAIVRPNDGAVPAVGGKVRITQSGAKCYNDTTLSYGWGKDRRDEVKFYSWYTDEELK